MSVARCFRLEQQWNHGYSTPECTRPLISNIMRTCCCICQNHEHNKRLIYKKIKPFSPLISTIDTRIVFNLNILILKEVNKYLSFINI